MSRKPKTHQIKWKAVQQDSIPQEPTWEELRDKEIEKRIEDEEKHSFDNKKIVPKTQNQIEYIESINKNEITICYGPPGAGKTLLAVNSALEHLYNNKINQIIFCRPLIACDENLGFLPGDLQEKIDPFMMAIYQNFEKIIEKKIFEKLFKQDKIKVLPLALMRGMTFDKSFVILDEASNCTYNQLKMFLTRIGTKSKMVLCGDTKQSDLDYYEKDSFDEIIFRLKNIENIGIVKLESSDIFRNKIIKVIEKRL